MLANLIDLESQKLVWIAVISLINLLSMTVQGSSLTCEASIKMSLFSLNIDNYSPS